MLRGSLTLFLLLSALSARSNATDELIARLKRDYPPALKRLEAAYGRSKGLGTITTSQVTGSNAKFKVVFAADQGCRKLVLSPVTAEPGRDSISEHVYCIGRELAFEVKKKLNSAYFLVDLQNDVDFAAFPEKFTASFIAPISIDGIPMSLTMGMLDSVVGAEEVIVAEKKLIRVDFKLPVEPEGYSIGFEAVTFDPDLDWAIRKTESRHEQKDTPLSITKVEYGPKRDGIPILKKVTMNDALTGVTVFEAESVTFEPVPSSEFTLDHYGLTTPQMEPLRQTGWGMRPWFVAAAALVTLVVFLAWRAIRAR